MAMMRSCFILFISMIILSSSSYALKFNVGGKDGWGVKPSSYYNHWAQKNRFQVNDTLYFKYHKGSDSVLVVNNQDYNSCNTKNPIKHLDSGDSWFVLDRSGPFYFISGNVKNCQQGEKLIIVVLSPNHHHKQHQWPSSSPAVAPVHSPAPSQSTSAKSPTWNAPAPSWNAPASSWNAPASSWNAPAPSWNAPAPAWNVPAPKPAVEVAPATSPIVENSPAPAPAHSGSTRLSGSVGVIVLVALVLGSFAI